MDLDPTALRGLSLWRPWPDMFFVDGAMQDSTAEGAPWGPKWIENRWRPLPFRLRNRWLTLHATQRYDREAAEWLRRHGFRPRLDAECPVGIVGLVRFFGCCRRSLACDFSGISHEMALTAVRSPWAMGPYLWVVDRAIRLPRPVPCKGRQGPGWAVPLDAAHQVCEQMNGGGGA